MFNKQIFIVRSSNSMIILVSNNSVLSGKELVHKFVRVKFQTEFFGGCSLLHWFIFLIVLKSLFIIFR